MAYKLNVFTGQFDLVTPASSGGGGDVTGPASSVDGDIAIFDGATGKVIKDSGITVASLAHYIQIFNATTDWTGPTGSSYSISIPFSTHGKTNPILQTYELNGSDYVEVETGIRIDTSHNVLITVNSSPDLRFAGKIHIV